MEQVQAAPSIQRLQSKTLSRDHLEVHSRIISLFLYLKSTCDTLSSA